MADSLFDETDDVPRRPPRRRGRVVVAVLAIVGLLAAAGGTWWYLDTQRKARDDENTRAVVAQSDLDLSSWWKSTAPSLGLPADRLASVVFETGTPLAEQLVTSKTTCTGYADFARAAAGLTPPAALPEVPQDSAERVPAYAQAVARRQEVVDTLAAFQKEIAAQAAGLKEFCAFYDTETAILVDADAAEKKWEAALWPKGHVEETETWRYECSDAKGCVPGPTDTWPQLAKLYNAGAVEPTGRFVKLYTSSCPYSALKDVCDMVAQDYTTLLAGQKRYAAALRDRDNDALDQATTDQAAASKLRAKTNEEITVDHPEAEGASDAVTYLIWQELDTNENALRQAADSFLAEAPAADQAL